MSANIIGRSKQAGLPAGRHAGAAAQRDKQHCLHAAVTLLVDRSILRNIQDSTVPAHIRIAHSVGDVLIDPFCLQKRIGLITDDLLTHRTDQRGEHDMRCLFFQAEGRLLCADLVRIRVHIGQVVLKAVLHRKLISRFQIFLEAYRAALCVLRRYKSIRAKRMDPEVFHLRTVVGNRKMNGDRLADPPILAHLQRRADTDIICRPAVLFHVAHIPIQNILLHLGCPRVLRHDQALCNGMLHLAQILMEMAHKIHLTFPIEPIHLIFCDQLIELFLGEVPDLALKHFKCLLIREGILSLQFDQPVLFKLQPLSERMGQRACQTAVDQILRRSKITGIFLFLNILRQRDR